MEAGRAADRNGLAESMLQGDIFHLRPAKKAEGVLEQRTGLEQARIPGSMARLEKGLNDVFHYSH